MLLILWWECPPSQRVDITFYVSVSSEGGQAHVSPLPSRPPGPSLLPENSRGVCKMASVAEITFLQRLGWI